MPDEIKTEVTLEPKPSSADDIRAAVAAGVETAFETVLKRAGEQQQQANVSRETSSEKEPPEPTTDDIDRQIDEAAAAGQPIAALMRKRDEIVEARVERRLVRPLREVGASAISGLAADSIVSKPYYEKLKPTINSLLSTVPRGTVLTKQHYEWAYNQARGQHADEIERIVEENAIRKAKEPPVANPPATAGRSAEAQEDDENADFQTAFGRGTASVFRRKNSESRQKRSEDDEARMMGFADRRDMMKARKELLDSEDFSLGLDK